MHPEKDVYLIYGDGSVGYSLIEWDTFMRHNIPIIGIIGKDCGWMQVSREQVDTFEDSVGTELGDRFYEKVVEGFGVTGLLIENNAELSTKFAEGQRITKSGNSVLINVLLGRGEFRKGSISM